MPPPSKQMDIVYIIDLQRTHEFGLRFFQNPSTAVFCDHNIPPECISEIVTMEEGSTLYKNKWLNGEHAPQASEKPFRKSASPMAEPYSSYCHTRGDNVEYLQQKAATVDMLYDYYCR